MRLLLLSVLPLLAAAAEPAPPRSLIFGADFETNRPASAHDLFFECGLNCVRLTGGGYSWAAQKHAAWAKELATLGVQVYLQLGSHYPSADYFSRTAAWLVDQNGKTGVEDRTSWAIRYDHSCWPQYSYADQGFREQLRTDFAAYLTHFPADPMLSGVILHNEPGMHWLNGRVFDYGAASVAGYRAWLPSQHRDIATLNRRYGTAFADFAAVEPPHQATENAARWLDWRRFQVFQIGEFMAWEAGFTKTLRPDLARTTNLDGSTNNWYAIRCADIEAYSRAMDTVGMDIYPTRWTDRAFVPYAVDQLIGVAQGRRAHVLECEVFSSRSEEFHDVDEAHRAELLRSALWTMYGHGVDGVLLWGFSRGDSFSLTDGEWNPRVLACRDLVAQQRMLGLGNFRRTPARVALCIDPDAYLFASTRDSAPLAGGSELDRECHGLHAALSAAGIACDVIESAQLPAVTARYQAIILPAAPLMDQATADRLRDFVSAGGTLITQAPFAAYDRWGAALPTAPGFGLAGSPTANVEEVPAEGGLPTRRSTPLGRGRTVVFAGAVGSAFLDGHAPALPAVLARSVAASGIAPRLRVQTTAAVVPDACLLDAGDDRLLVVTVHGEKGRAAAPATGVLVALPGYRPTAAFAFPATTERDGVVRSGPQPVALAAAADGCALTLGTVSGALPVLLTAGHAPLLSLELPATATASTTVTLAVTCHNPSATALSGTLDLVFPGQSTSAPVSVAPWGQQRVTLQFTTPATGERLPIGATLRSPSCTVTAIPVDLRVH
jgi:hypothetical protein